jgi:hypothetical protein
MTLDPMTFMLLMALLDQAITALGKIRKLPHMTKEEKVLLIEEMGGLSDELIDQMKAELDKLRTEVGGQ